MAIKAKQSDEQLDADFSAINDAQNADHNGKIIYIRRGQLDYDTFENLFTVVELTAE